MRSALTPGHLRWVVVSSKLRLKVKATPAVRGRLHVLLHVHLGEGRVAWGIRIDHDCANAASGGWQWIRLGHGDHINIAGVS